MRSKKYDKSEKTVLFNNCLISKAKITTSSSVNNKTWKQTYGNLNLRVEAFLWAWSETGKCVRYFSLEIQNQAIQAMFLLHWLTVYIFCPFVVITVLFSLISIMEMFLEHIIKKIRSNSQFFWTLPVIKIFFQIFFYIICRNPDF